jgi:hypothetical protein
MLRQSGIDNQTVRVLYKKCGWYRAIAHSGCADGRRALVRITRSKDPSHVLHADVIEVPEEKPIEEALAANPGFRDLNAEALEKGLIAMEREFLPLLEDQACPRCHSVGHLELSQIHYLGRHVRY